VNRTMDTTPRSEPSLGELFAELSRETTTLVRQEVALAKSELSAKAARAARHVGFIAVGGVIVYAGVLTLAAALVIVFANAGLSWWAAAVIVGLVLLVAGAVSTQMGVAALRHESMAPVQTLDTLKDNVQWAKNQVK
jgi:hypothetical protein